VFLGSLQDQAGHAGDVVAGIFQDIVEMLAKDGGFLRACSKSPSYEKLGG
jgi:hypothetical protein